MLYKQLQFTTGWFGKLMFKFDSKIDIRFDDVIGYDAQKIKLRQAISKILNNQESKPKGIIIKGPEGTGKTFMAKAFIGEAQMPYMIISGGEVKSATDIKRIFSVARLKKSCIIFFDELGIVPISSINVSLLAGTDVNNQVLNRIKELLNKFYEETKKIITEHKDMVTEIAEKLLEQKILDEKEAYEIYDKYQSK